MIVLLVALTHLKKTCQQKNITPMNRIAIQLYDHVISEMEPKVDCSAGFCYHRVVTMNAYYTHTYRYPLFENGMKTGS